MAIIYKLYKQFHFGKLSLKSTSISFVSRIDGGDGPSVAVLQFVVKTFA